MNASHWTDRLSEYLDGELTDVERASCEAHLAGCAECAGVLEELKAVAAAARALPAAPPSAEVWSAIEARLETPVLRMRPRAELRERLSRRWTLSMGQLAAMAACLVAITAGAMWLAGRGGSNGRQATGPVAVAPPATGATAPQGTGDSARAGEAGDGAAPSSAAAPTLLAHRENEGGDEEREARDDAAGHAVPAVAADFGVGRYDAAIAELQQSLEQRRSTLDSSTVRVVEQNLAIIDKAIDDARKALATDPSSRYLNAYLASTMRRKVDLLRRVNSLARI